MESPGNGTKKNVAEQWKALQGLIDLAKQAKANDTEGMANTMSNLFADLEPQNSTIGGHKAAFFESMGEGNWTSFGLSGNWNETELNSNWTDVAYNGTNKLASLLSGFLNRTSHRGGSDDLSSGFSGGEIGNFTWGGHGKETEEDILENHSPIMRTLSNIIMVTFVYYIPRIIYFRMSRITSDVKEPYYFLILFLSVIPVIGVAFHGLSAHFSVTSNALVAIVTSPETFSLNNPPDYETPSLYKALTASINRLVSPIITLVLLQQIASNSGVNTLNKGIVQILLSVTVTVIVFGYTFFVENEVLAVMQAKLEEAKELEIPMILLPSYPDHHDLDLFDVIPPIIGVVLFFVARSKLSRSDTYAERSGPNQPTIIDRISKPIVFQAVMTAIALIAWFLSDEKEATSSMKTFFVAGQTPVVHWVLIRSLMRARKSNRLCFLLCCCGVEKVGAVETQEAANNEEEKVADEEKNGENQKNEEEDEEDTQETVDHNKIILKRESQVNAEKEGTNVEKS